MVGTLCRVSYVCRKMKVKGVDCICLSLNFLNGALGSPNDKTCIEQLESAIGNHVQLTPYKTRQRFLSPESDEDHFKIIKGVDVVGRTHYLRALALPEHLLPSSLKRTAEGIQVSDECEDDTPAVTINQGAKDKIETDGAPAVTINQAQEDNIETGYFDPVVVEENAGDEMELDDIFVVNAVKETETMDKQNKPSGSKKRSRRGNILDSLKDYLTEKEQNLPAKRSRKKKSK